MQLLNATSPIPANQPAARPTPGGLRQPARPAAAGDSLQLSAAASPYRSRREELTAIADMADPALRNVRITHAYHQLSQAMHRAVGGTSWVTLAKWASKRAGQTIRRQDVPGGRATLGALAVAATALLGPVGLAGALFARAELKKASDAIAGGNQIVFREIGLEFDRFLTAFAADAAPDEAKLQAYLAGLRPGPAAAGGQQLLRDAFAHYYRARFAADPQAREQLMLQANFEVGLHEQSRLQPYIERALPGPLRKLATRFMTLPVPGKQLRLSKDVTTREGSKDQPAYLRPMSPELAAGLRGWDRRLDTLADSAATDWASLPERMNYIGNFFEAYQQDQRARAQAPFTPQQQAQMQAGRLPHGKL